MDILLLIAILAFFALVLFKGTSRSKSEDDSSSEPYSPLESRDQWQNTQRQTVKKAARSEADILAALPKLPKNKVLKVCDGDTLIVAQGWGEVRIRLDSIDCPEQGQPWGDVAKYGLIKLVGGNWVKLEEHGTDIHGRTLATVYAQHKDTDEWLNVNERMVTLGHAWVMRLHYDHLPQDRKNKLNRLENWAKSKRLGLWNTENPVPPWQWRKTA